MIRLIMRIPIISYINEYGHYRYTKKCMHMIASDKFFNSTYPGMRVSFLGVLNFPMMVPATTDSDDMTHYALVSKLQPLSDVMSEMQLYDIATIDKELIDPSTGLYMITVIPVFLLRFWQGLIFRLLLPVAVLVVIAYIGYKYEAWKLLI